MRTAPQVVVKANLDARTEYILKEYSDLTTSPEILYTKLGYLAHRIPKTIYSDWVSAIECADWSRLVQSLLLDHYDPSYQRSLKNNQRKTIHTVELMSCSPKKCAIAAHELSKIRL